MQVPILERHLIYVTGKGGVGKTTVAAALATAAAAQGRRTIVCEVAEQDRVSRAFHRVGVRGESEIQIAENLWAVTIDPQAAVVEWLSRQISATLVRTLTRSSAFQYFAAAAPGARELITMSKIWELAQPERWSRANRTYDLVVADAPASGHGLAMLRTPQTFADIARVGPVRRQADRVRTMLADPAATAYVAVALPEEMPVAETLELGPRLQEIVGSSLDAIIVNGLYPERFDADEAAMLATLAKTEPAARAALSQHERARSQRSHLRRLRRQVDGTRVLTLPHLFEGELGPDAWSRLGAELARRL